MFDGLRFRLRALFWRDAAENQLDDELRFHFDREVEKLISEKSPRMVTTAASKLIHEGAP